MKLTKKNLTKSLPKITDKILLNKIYEGFDLGLYKDNAPIHLLKFYENKSTSYIVTPLNEIEFTINEMIISDLYQLNFIKKEIIYLQENNRIIQFI